MSAESRTPSPFETLFRTFCGQFITNESAVAEMRTRQAIAGVVAFIFAPGLALMVALFPQYAVAVIQVQRRLAPPGVIDDMLEGIVFMFVTYSMLAVGVVAVSAWDALTFDRRDAMVLGHLPVRWSTLIGAKLSALGAFVLVSATAINLFYALLFALETSDQFGVRVFIDHFIGYLLVTVGAAIFVFCAIVTLRALILTFAGSSLAASIGSLLQFALVIALLSLVFMSSAVFRTRFMSSRITDWMPATWFVGLFEWVRGSPRMARPEFVALAWRAALAMPLAVLATIVVSVLAFRRQMQRALAPSAFAGPIGRARLTRALARGLVGGNRTARGVVDFILLTIARNRAQQAPIAVNSAVGAAITIAAAVARVRDAASLSHPRIVVLWIPLVIVYWMTLGIRSSFAVPSELQAAWTFRANGSGDSSAYWLAIRASMMALVGPVAVGLTFGITTPLLGWRTAAWHALYVLLMTMLAVETAAMSIRYIPFTRTYFPSHARLTLTWPLFLIGLFVFADWSTRVEMGLLSNPTALLKLDGALALLVLALAWRGRRLAATRWTAPHMSVDESDESWESVIVLGIGRLRHRSAPLVPIVMLLVGGAACTRVSVPITRAEVRMEPLFAPNTWPRYFPTPR